MTGSLINNLYGRMTKGAPTPEVGMGATLLSYTDRHAATVIAYDNMKGIVTVQRDRSRRADKLGMSDAQTYEYTADTNGPVYHFRMRKGKWVQIRWNNETNRWNLNEGYGLIIGHRDEHYDFSF